MTRSKSAKAATSTVSISDLSPADIVKLAQAMRSLPSELISIGHGEVAVTVGAEDIASMEQAAAAVAAIREANRLVLVEALCLLCWDGDPDRPGAEHYAPRDFDVVAHKKANGIEGEWLDGNGEPVEIVGSCFSLPLSEAEGLVKAHQVKFVKAVA